jgi:hypothetical protein
MRFYHMKLQMHEKKECTVYTCSTGMYATLDIVLNRTTLGVSLDQPALGNVNSLRLHQAYIKFEMARYV